MSLKPLKKTVRKSSHHHKPKKHVRFGSPPLRNQESFRDLYAWLSGAEGRLPQELLRKIGLAILDWYEATQQPAVNSVSTRRLLPEVVDKGVHPVQPPLGPAPGSQTPSSTSLP